MWDPLTISIQLESLFLSGVPLILLLYVSVDISLSCKTVRKWRSCAFENDPLGPISPSSVVCVKHAQFLSGGEPHVPSFAGETHLNSDQNSGDLL